MAGAYPLYGIHDDAVPQLKKIDGFDYGGDTCGDASDGGACPTVAAVRLDGSLSNSIATKVSVHDVHAEGLAGTCGTSTGLVAAVDDRGVPATIEGVHASCQVPDAVVLGAASAGVSPVTQGTHLTNIVPYAASGNCAVVDNVNTINCGIGGGLPAGQVVGEYDIEQVGNFLNPAGSSDLAGGLTLGGNLTLPAGGSVSSLDTGTPKITFGSSSLSMNQPLTLATPLTVANGGTGATALGSSGNILLGNGTSAISASSNTISSSAPSSDNSMLLFSSAGTGSFVRGPQVFNGASLSPATGSTPVTIGTFANNVDSGASYYLFCDLQANAASSSNGLKVGINGTAGSATATTALVGLQGVSVSVSAVGSGFNTFIGAATGGTGTVPYHFSASLLINGGGSIAVQYESAGTGNVTIDSYACVLQ